MKSPKQIIGKKYNIEKDGITQGLLANWMDCRVKALYFLQGWSPKSPNMALTYGSVVHEVIGNVYEDIMNKKLKDMPSKQQTMKYISRVEKLWIAENPRADKKTREFMELALLIAEATMPAYFDYWHKDIKDFKWQELENEFYLPFALPDGRKTHLRGKLDGVYKSPKLWLMENKTKSRLDESTLVDYLPFELQVMFYILSLILKGNGIPKGVLYNIIRRTALKQGKKESMPQFAKRCSEDIIKRPDFYFIRLEVSIGQDDLEMFSKELFAMIKDFYDWYEGKIGHYRRSGACEGKYGRCDYLGACNGRFNALTKRKQVFNELEEGN